MRASLGPVLANIIMTECEIEIIDNLVKEGTIKFYDCMFLSCHVHVSE